MTIPSRSFPNRSQPSDNHLTLTSRVCLQQKHSLCCDVSASAHTHTPDLKYSHVVPVWRNQQLSLSHFGSEVCGSFSSRNSGLARPFLRSFRDFSEAGAMTVWITSKGISRFSLSTFDTAPFSSIDPPTRTRSPAS